MARVERWHDRLSNRVTSLEGMQTRYSRISTMVPRSGQFRDKDFYILIDFFLQRPGHAEDFERRSTIIK